MPRLVGPIRWLFATPLGDGHQWWPWVHIDDLVRCYVRAIGDDGMHDSHNVCASQQVTNRTFMRTVARVLHRPFLDVPVPGLAVKLALGEASTILLHGSRASNTKLLATGFRFEFDDLDAALRDLLQ